MSRYTVQRRTEYKSGVSAGDGRLLAEISDSATRMNLTFTEAQAMAQHPMFHITPPSGWMNDPNGMFQLGALYHVFYQWNPAAGEHWIPAAYPVPYCFAVYDSDISLQIHLVCSIHAAQYCIFIAYLNAYSQWCV